MEPQEFEIPVPWGHISGMSWGGPNGLPVLCLHGVQDNAGSFERLVPLLPRHYRWVAIDLPGHGRSSHFEPGRPIEFTHFAYAVYYVARHFQWKKFHLMGHSLGAQTAAMFAAIYPELVLSLVLIDGLLPPFNDESVYSQSLRQKFENNFKLEEALGQKTPPVYTREEATERLRVNRPNPITPEGAQSLVKRNLLQVDNGVRYSTDQRMKLLPNPVQTYGQSLNIIQSIKCPVMIVIANASLEKTTKTSFRQFYSPEMLDQLMSFPNFIYKRIDGYHDVHLNNPEGVAALVRPFYRDTKSSL